VAFLVFILTACLASALVWRMELQRVQVERARVLDLAGVHARSLQISIERALTSAYALGALVRLGHGTVADFDALVGEMLPYYPGVSALELAPGGVIRQVMPLAGNEKAVGFDLLQDPVQRKEAAIARDTGKLTLAGPINLVQGGLGIAGRLPVFLQDRDGLPSFWGFTVVVIRFPGALVPARFTQIVERGLHYELWRTHPDSGRKQVIDASSATPLAEPVDVTLELPNGTWTLSVSPARGWGDPAGLALKFALGLLACLTLAYLAKLMVELREHQQGLETLVARRTAEVGIAETRLLQSQKMEAIGKLAGGIAHDFNNLLTPILGYAEMLQSDLKNAGVDTEPLQFIAQAALKARDLTRQLLSFGRKQTLELRVIDLNETVSSIVVMLRRTIRESIEIRLEPAAAPARIRADATQIERVVMNLLVNAQDAIVDAGVITIAIEEVVLDAAFVRTHPDAREGSFVQLTVADSGRGIDPEVLPRIFEPFFSTKEAGRGAGLGLATVYGIVRQHEGNIWVSSGAQGTAFTIVFPTAAGEPAGSAGPTAAAASRDEKKGSGNILLVEDDASVLALVRSLLSEGGYTVSATRDPREALRLAVDRRFDLLVADVVMPGMSGPELHRCLLAAHPELKVLFMSGYAGSALGGRVEPGKGVHYIQKPFSTAAFANEVAQIMRS
jgi:signal transduction histidine kinase/CheY-like chemotaxis protein